MKNFITGLVFALFLLAIYGLCFADDKQPSQTTVSIQELKLFPEKYVGQKLVFDKCYIFREIKKEEGFYCIGFIFGTGMVSPIWHPYEISFVISESMAEKMIKGVDGNIDGKKVKTEVIRGERFWANCMISCCIQKTNKYYIAVIDQITMDVLVDKTRKGLDGKKIEPKLEIK